jgi:FkbM family methyltransferase
MMRGQRPLTPPAGTATRNWPLEFPAVRRAPPGLVSPKQRLRRLFEKLTGTRIYRTLPRGIDRFADVENWLPNLHIGIVFDVGANIGQSARSYLANFPNAQIYCFEPVGATHRQLERQLRGYANVRSFKLALGAEAGPGTMVLEGSPDMFFLRRGADAVTTPDDAPVERVAVETLDNFCRSHAIDHIHYLKIDAEGADLDVLLGGEGLLNGQHVDVVEAECGMHGQNKRHVALDTLAKFLEDRSYRLFGIYEQVHEWPTGAPNLRRANPIFISDSVIRENIAS